MSYYKPYYIFSFFLLSFSILTFWFSKNLKIYFVIIGVSLLLTFYLFESFLLYKHFNRYEVQKIKQKIYFENTGKNYDTRPLIEVYQSLKEKGYTVKSSDIGYYLHKENPKLKIFPLTGISKTKTIVCNENGYYSIFESDRFGFNNPDKEWNNAQIDFAIIGDSYVQGDCLDRPKDMGSLLRKLSGKTVLNFGVGGSGILIQYGILKEYLPKNVKNIILFFYEGNDIKNLKTELEFQILNNYLENDKYTQKLKSRQNEIDDLIKKYINKVEAENSKSQKQYLIENSSKKLENFTKFLKLYRTRLLILKPQMKVPDEFGVIIDKIIKIASQKNSKLYFVYLPEYSRYKGFYYRNDQLKEVQSIIENKGIRFIDINKEVFSKEDDPLKLFPFGLYGHYTSEGYSKITNFIYNNLN